MSARRLYNARWRKARLLFLRQHPLCAPCQRQGRLTAATVVDHIIPHRGDYALFWDEANWQPICAPCHNSAKQSFEKGGRRHLAACDADGRPINPQHPWNAEGDGEGGEDLKGDAPGDRGSAARRWSARPSACSARIRRRSCSAARAT